MITIKIEHVTVQVVEQGKLDEILTHLLSMQKTLKEIKMTEQEALTVIKSVADHTTAIGVVVQSEADTLQKVNDVLDQIIAGKLGSVSPAVAAALSGLAAPIQSVSDNLDAVAKNATDILAKGQAAIPVTPLPEPTPAPAPLPV